MFTITYAPHGGPRVAVSHHETLLNASTAAPAGPAVEALTNYADGAATSAQGTWFSESTLAGNPSAVIVGPDGDTVGTFTIVEG